MAGRDLSDRGIRERKRPIKSPKRAPRRGIHFLLALGLTPHRKYLAIVASYLNSDKIVKYTNSRKTHSVVGSSWNNWKRTAIVRIMNLIGLFWVAEVGRIQITPALG